LAEGQADGSPVRTAIIGYFSDETARTALRDFHDNMALGLDRPLKLEYYGPVDMNEVGMPPRPSAFFFWPLIAHIEVELIKGASMAMLLNGIDHG